MNKACLLVLLLLATRCWGQDSYPLPLTRANTALSLPSMAARGSVLYEAHRSFNGLRFSSQLEVSAFDLTTHKELRHAAVRVPRVHGARAADGFYLSPDGHELVYAELYAPQVVLVLSTKDLSVVRRKGDLPYTSADSLRLFAGFDESGLLCFGSIHGPRLRFIRVELSSFNVRSDIVGPKPHYYNVPFAWSPKSQKVWIQGEADAWREYRENGAPTGEEVSYEGKKFAVVSYASVLGATKLVAFYGNLINKGAVVTYSRGHTAQLELGCVPRPYSSGNVPDYVGAICTTSPDREPEHGGNKILTSEFLLLNADGPKIIWRHPMEPLSVSDSKDMNAGIQWGDPLLYRDGSKLLVVAPTSKPELVVYEVTLPN